MCKNLSIITFGKHLASTPGFLFHFCSNIFLLFHNLKETFFQDESFCKKCFSNEIHVPLFHWFKKSIDLIVVTSDYALKEVVVSHCRREQFEWVDLI